MYKTGPRAHAQLRTLALAFIATLIFSLVTFVNFKADIDAIAARVIWHIWHINGAKRLPSS